MRWLTCGGSNLWRRSSRDSIVIIIYTYLIQGTVMPLPLPRRSLKRDDCTNTTILYDRQGEEARTT
jgi:hypothetical protein